MGNLRRTYQIHHWKFWDHEFDLAVQDFVGAFSVFPNTVLANSITYARIDLIAKKGHVAGESGKKPEGSQHVVLGGFVGKNYQLDFCLEENLADREFALVFDDNPDGKEPMPKTDTQDHAEARIKTRKIA